MINVYIEKCSSYNEKEVKRAIKQIVTHFEIIKSIKRNSKVIIKANLVSAMQPDKNATTHPMLLRALTDYLVEKGCHVIIGDSPGGIYNKKFLARVYKATKMDTTNAKLNDNFGVSHAYFKDGKVLKNFDYTSYLDDCDILINVCKLKTHGMMSMSCAVKNMFGTIPGTMKPEYHYRFPNHSDFANMLIDLNEYFKPSINIVDAVDGMEGNGPTMGKSKHIGLILASPNPYALDYVASQIINLNPFQVETIKQSLNRKLFAIDEIKTNDDVNKYIIKDFKNIKKLNSISFYKNSNNPISKIIALVSKNIFENKPYLHKNKCICCSKCANICPAKAITMVNNHPVIDRTKCIKCYCCQEFCPVGAMQVKTSVFAKILNFHNKK